MRFWRPGLRGKLTWLLLLACAVGIALGLALARSGDADTTAIALVLLLLLPVCWLLAHLALRSIRRLLRALEGSVVALHDGDFSVALVAGRGDELGTLVDAHNELGRVLREERQNLFQRELLLHTLVQNAPTAMLLANARGHIVHANLAARHLFNQGRRVEGLHLDALVASVPATIGEAMAQSRDGLYGVEIDGNEEVYHLATRSFRLHGQPHRLFLLRRMTREISRQEVASWKKVIRVISHELNNSLAPISSLAHSGRTLAARGDHARLMEVLATIGERAGHLGDFIRGYSAFAKLPLPRLEPVHWPDFVNGLAVHSGARVVGEPASEPMSADPAQLEQALINLLRNAGESGSPADAIEIEIVPLTGEWRIEVRDRGPGMSETVLANALVPFYSTKRSGTGLGLALAREIAEAHGGHLSLANREGGGLVARLTLPRGPRGDGEDEVQPSPS